jgi:hypothetical protein
MRLPFKIALGALAAFGALGVLSMVFFWVVPHCTTVTSALARSPDGKYLATFTQTTCPNAAKNHAEVYLSATGGRGASEVFGVKNTSFVGLNWKSFTELEVVTVPSAVLTKYAGLEAGPKVTVRRLDENWVVP